MGAKIKNWIPASAGMTDVKCAGVTSLERGGMTSRRKRREDERKVEVRMGPVMGA